jgi:hypothetical protein
MAGRLKSVSVLKIINITQEKYPGGLRSKNNIIPNLTNTKT